MGTWALKRELEMSIGGAGMRIEQDRVYLALRHEATPVVYRAEELFGGP